MKVCKSDCCTVSSATFVIAASDSLHKLRADYVCDGVDDQVEIQAAIDALPADGGMVNLMDGTFDFTSAIDIGSRNTLSGTGFGTIIKLNKTHNLSTYDKIIQIGDYSVCKHLCLDGNAWSDQDIDTDGVGLGNYATIRNCEIKEVRQYAVESAEKKGAKIIDNIIHHTKYPVTLSGFSEPVDDGGTIRGNACYEYEFYMKVVAAKNARITENTLFKTFNGSRGIALEGDFGPNINIKITDNIIVDDLGTGNEAGISINADSENLSKNIQISGNLINGFHMGMAINVAGVQVSSNICTSSRYTGIRVKGSDVALVNNQVDCGIIIDGGSRCFISNNQISGGSPYWRADNSGIFIWGEYSSPIGTVIESNKIYNCVGHGIYISDEENEVGNVTIKNNHLHNLTGNSIQATSSATVLAYSKYSDLLMDVLAVSAIHVRQNEDLSAATPSTFTLDAQPDVPRTLSAHFDTHANITEYDIEIIGIDAKGNTVTETKDETDGWDWETSNAFTTITSIKMTSRTGTGVGDTMDIGITDVLGLSNIFYETGDVFKIKKNNANAVVAGAQVDTTYHTYDMSVIGLAATDDFTIWYRSNLNMIG